MPSQTGSIDLKSQVIARNDSISVAASDATTKANAAQSAAEKVATNYITRIDNNGITVHPSGGSTSRVQVNASGTTIYQNNVDVASYGASARIGKANGDRVEVDSTNGVTIYMGNSKRLQTSANGIEVYGSDGSTSIASFGSEIRLGGESSPHICIDNYGIDMFDNNGGTGNLQEAVRIDSSVRHSEYAGGRIQFSPNISSKESVVEGICTPTSSSLTIDAMRLISDTWYGPSMSMTSDSNGSEDNFLELRASTSANYSELTIYPTRFDFMNSDVNVFGGNGRAISVSGGAGAIYLRSTESNVGLSDDSGNYLIREDTSGYVYLNGHNITDVEDHKFFAAPNGGGDAYFRNIWVSDIPSTSPTSLSLNTATKAYSSGMTPKYRKWGGVVNVYGAVSPKSQVAAEGTLAIGTLPSGYRPALNSTWLCQGSGTAVWTLQINTDGTMTASRYRTGTTYAAMPDSAWLIFNVTFIVS